MLTITCPEASSFFPANYTGNGRVAESVRPRVKMEKRIARKVIADALGRGYLLSVNDGEEVTLKKSNNADDVLLSMSTTDEDYLIVHDENGARIGWVRFVYGNDGYDVICDYTTNLEGLLKGANDLADRLSR